MAIPNPHPRTIPPACSACGLLAEILPDRAISPNCRSTYQKIFSWHVPTHIGTYVHPSAHCRSLAALRHRGKALVITWRRMLASQTRHECCVLLLDVPGSQQLKLTLYSYTRQMQTFAASASTTYLIKGSMYYVVRSTLYTIYVPM
jgi:hypothetical protein